MTDRLALEYVEIDLPYCSLTYGLSPCQASLGSPGTGSIKCFNSRATCQDLANFDPVDTTVRFSRQADYLPRTIDSLPYLDSVEYNPAIVSLGENLGQRAELKFILQDYPHSDVGPGFDKYWDERAYDPYTLGTIFGRLRSRYPSLRGVAVRWIMGFVGDSLASMETRHFFIESFSGPTADGKFSIVAKDALKFLDGDRAVAPTPNGGSLANDITESALDAALSPVGIISEYAASGYVAIGGNEIVEYTVAPVTIDSDVKLMLHGNGTDASTTFTDSSASALTPTANGNVQIDTAQSVFGGASILFDGTGDYLQYADNAIWTPAGDFTFDMRVRFSAVSATRPLVIHFTDANNNYQLRLQADNSWNFILVVAGVTQVNLVSAVSLAATNTWYHIAVERFGNLWTLFRDGAVIASATVAVSIPDFTSSFRVGTNSAASVFHAGWIDELRFSHVARYSGAAFTPYPLEYSTSAPDHILISARGALGTTASAHSAGDRVQTVLRYEAETPAFIIDDLLASYTDTPASYRDLAAWEAECAAYLARVYTLTVPEPTPVASLVSEMVVQAALALWDDNLEQVIRLQVLRGIVSNILYDESVMVRGSFSGADQPEKRVSQVLVYYGQIDPTKPLSNDDNYRSTVHVVDDDAESAYGVSIRKIYARAIPEFGSSTAERLAEIVIGRYKIAPRKFGFQLIRESVPFVELGAGALLEYWNLQDATGAAESVPSQIVRMKSGPAVLALDCEEMRFDVPADDLQNRSITIDFTTNNVNLRSAHDALFPEPEDPQPSPPISVTFTIAAAVIVGSTDVTVPAIDVGSWPTGVEVSLIVAGRIQGRGGNGGRGETFTPLVDGQPGVAGGTALYTRYPIDLDGGEVWGGGGGGGGGTADGGGSGGGGGGAGTQGGTGGLGGISAHPGADGTAIAGGAGGAPPNAGNNGGAGGGPGLAGSVGQGVNGGAGGAVGNAIDGDSFVTIVGTGEDLRGGQIN